MSQHPEFDDLGNRIKATRPITEPPPPQWQQQLRSELEEKSRMKQFPVFFNRLAGAVLALVLLIGVPLFFWQMLSNNQETAVSNPPSIQSDSALEESLPVATNTESPQESVPLSDTLKMLSVSPGPGSEIVVGEDTAVSLTLAYELHTADAAEMTIQLVDNDTFTIGTAVSTVTKGVGEVTAVISLNAPETILEGTEVRLSISLTDSESGRSLLEIVPAGMWTLQPPTKGNFIEIVNLPVAEPVEGASTTDGTQLFEINAELAYTLTDHEIAMVKLAGFYADGGMFAHTQRVAQGSGNLQMLLTLTADDLNEDGSINEAILTLTPYLIAFDEAVNEYTMLYPEIDQEQGERVIRELLNSPNDREAAQAESILDSLVPSSDWIIFSRMEHGVNEAGQMTFAPRVIYAQESLGTSQIEVTLQTEAELLATDSISITTYNDAVDLSLTVDAQQISDELPLTFTAEMTNEAGELRGVDTLLITMAELEPAAETAVWLIAENLTQNGDQIDVQLLIGYALGEDQPMAMFRSVSRYEPVVGSGGGGGGGGGPLLPGQYLEIINFTVSEEDLENGRSWRDVIGFVAEISESNANGEQQILATLADGLPVNMSNGGGGGGGGINSSENP